MLILARRPGERILIDGGRITVSVQEILGGREVVLGIEAPESVAIDREEVHERKRAGIATPGAVRHG